MTKNTSQLTGNGGFLSILGVLLSLLIIGYMSYLMLKSYTKEPLKDKATSGVLAEQGIKTDSYQGIMDSTKTKLNQVTQQQLDYYQKLDSIK